MADVVCTIGHSTHPIERLTGLLLLHGIDAVADVRSHPYSRYNPQFNRENLSTALKTAGITYVFLGLELGARSNDPACYEDGRVSYELLARTTSFGDGLGRIMEGMKRHRISLLCAEKDPLTCHRTILICRHLVERGVDARHILESGQVETHTEAMDRLLRELGLVDADLFRGHDDLLAEAYKQRGRQIAYVEKTSVPEEPIERLRQ